MYDNIAYALQVTGASRKQIRATLPDILRLTGLSTKLHNYPHQLSGGEQQRVAVARAFASHPPLLLADEPTGNLDPETSIGIMQLLYRINRAGTTVIVATHDNEMVDQHAPPRDRAQARADRPRRGLRAVWRARREHRRARASASNGKLDDEAGLLPQRGVPLDASATRVPSFAALASVLVTTLVLGVFIPVVQATNGAANDVRGRVLVDVDLNDQRDRRRSRARARRARSARRTSRASQFVSKQAGLRTGAQAQPAGLRADRLQPAAGHLPHHARQARNSGALRAELDQSSPLGTRLVTDPAIAAVQNRQAQTDKILSATRVIKITMALLAALLVLASMLLISNTIRLSLFSRRREVEVMKLVGATDWFIRWPFVLEGLFLGALGGAGGDRPARAREGHAGRSARQHRQADLPAGHDRLPAADRDPDGLRDRRLRRRLGHLAAALPQGLSP